MARLETARKKGGRMTQPGTAVASPETGSVPEKMEHTVSPTTSVSEVTKQAASVEKKNDVKTEKERFLFLRFQRTGEIGKERWESRKRIDDNTEIQYFIKDCSVVWPGSEEETWACRTIHESNFNNQIQLNGEIRFNQQIKIVVVELVSKTAFVFGKKQVITFYTNDWNAVLPRWSCTEKVSGVRIKRVPMKNGLIPTIKMRTWETEELAIIACEQEGSFQIIGVKLIRSVSDDTHLDSKQARANRETQKTANIKNNKVSRF